LPPEAREAWDRLALSTAVLQASSNRKIIPFREKALRKPIHDLIVFWKKAGLVHTSLTALTHVDEAFKVVWSKDLTQGVLDHDTYVRDFNEGIKYPNIRHSGLADFEHLRAVAKPTDEPEKALEAAEIGLKHGISALSQREGNAAFARSIAEVLIVAMVAALKWGLERKDVEPVTLATLVALLDENDGNGLAYRQAWQKSQLGGVFEDVQAAVASDILELSRLVRAGEVFLLCLEGWM